MEIKTGDFHLGMWFGGNKNGDSVLMNVYKRDGKWKMNMSIRQRVDDNVFNSKDKKNVISSDLAVDHAMEATEVKKKLDSGLVKFLSKFFYDMEYIEVMGDSEKFVFILAQQPWAHIKKLHTDSDEAKEFMASLEKEKKG